MMNYVYYTHVLLPVLPPPPPPCPISSPSFPPRAFRTMGGSERNICRCLMINYVYYTHVPLPVLAPPPCIGPYRPQYALYVRGREAG